MADTKRPWVVIDATIGDHPAFADAGPWAVLAFEELIKLSKRSHLRGHLPAKHRSGAAVRQAMRFPREYVVGDPMVPLATVLDAAIQELFRLGLLVLCQPEDCTAADDACARIRDWQQYQRDPTPAAERVAAWRARKAAQATLPGCYDGYAALRAVTGNRADTDTDTRTTDPDPGSIPDGIDPCPAAPGTPVATTGPGARAAGLRLSESELTAAARAVFRHWQTTMEKPDHTLTTSRKNRIVARLREGWSVSQLQRAIDGCRSSPFWMGDNPRNTVYNAIENIFRNHERVEQMIVLLERGPPPLKGSAPCGAESVSPALRAKMQEQEAAFRKLQAQEELRRR